MTSPLTAVATAASSSPPMEEDKAPGSSGQQVCRKRGRPRLPPGKPKIQTSEKLLSKINTSMSNNVGEPTVYVSTTKGGMKLLYDGHHFRYSFRKGQYSIFQCCYKENKEECKVRVVSDQKRVYPLDGEHVHFMQATDKSVTSVLIESGEANEERELEERAQFIAAVNAAEEQLQPQGDHEGFGIEITTVETVPYYQGRGTEGEGEDRKVSRMQLTAVEAQPQVDMQAVDATDFREKIKKRLQKALLGKKK